MIGDEKECITCRHLAVPINDYPCGECGGNKMPMWEDEDQPSQHWGIRMKEIEEEITKPVRHALEQWMKQDHTIKNPVKDGQERTSFMFNTADEEKGFDKAIADESASEKRMKNFFDKGEDSALVFEEKEVTEHLGKKLEEESYSDLDRELTASELGLGPKIEEGSIDLSPVFRTVPTDAQEVAGIKDSGKRAKFESGAVRDIQDNKGRFDLLPLLAMFRLAKHYERGCLKYGDRNWEKGIPLSRYADSAIRHLFKFVMGFQDEHHLTAALWNLASLTETRDRIEMGLLPKELNDLPDTFKNVSYEVFEEVLNQLL